MDLYMLYIHHCKDKLMEDSLLSIDLNKIDIQKHMKYNFL